LKRPKRTTRYAGIRGGIIALVVVASAWAGLLSSIERWELDRLFALRGPLPPRAPIVIVSIDEDSFDELNLPWPWPRALHGQFLDLVSQGRPAVIGMDILFSEPSARGPEDDAALAAAVRRAGNVVLAAARTVVQDPYYAKTDLNPPIEPIRDGAAGIGLVNYSIDPDAAVRMADLKPAATENELPDFDLLLARLAGEKGAGVVSKGLPTSFYINYRGGPRTFATVPYHRVLSGEVSPSLFAGKIVLVGSTSPALHDVYPTPFAPHGDMPGVEIHANVLETIIQGIPLTWQPSWANLLDIGLGAFFTVAVTHRFGPLLSLGLVLSLGVIATVAGFIGFAKYEEIPHIAPVWIALGLGYGTTVLENYIEERRNRARLLQLFSPYVGPQILNELLKDPEKARQGSCQRREVTLLFCDVVGFVKFCESHKPQEIVSQMNEYLGAMTEVVFHWGGTLIDFKGDEVYALWGAPLEQADHAERAVKCAMHMRQRLAELNVKWAAEGKTQLQNGVGLNTGTVLFANMGAEGKRMKFEAVGDCVNLASRVEGLTRKFGVSIMLTEITAELIKPLLAGPGGGNHQGRLGHVMLRKVASVKVKGREQPVVVYELKSLDHHQPSLIDEPETVEFVVMTEK
jgi:adenylate cyclase